MIAIDAPLTSTNTTPTKHLETFHEKYPDIKLDIACYNGPNQYVVAGRTINIELLELHLQDKIASGEKLSFKILKDVHAYHSAMADSIVGQCAKLSAEISFQVSFELYFVIVLRYLFPVLSFCFQIRTCNDLESSPLLKRGWLLDSCVRPEDFGEFQSAGELLKICDSSNTYWKLSHIVWQC